jgi:hypothetical protein
MNLKQWDKHFDARFRVIYLKLAHSTNLASDGYGRDGIRQPRLWVWCKFLFGAAPQPEHCNG